MNFLVDTDICSAYIKGHPAVWNRFVQHSGGIAISAVTAGELWAWVSRKKTSEKSRNTVTDFIEAVDVLEVDLAVALRFGELRGQLLDNGITIPNLDGLIVATALVGNLILVTHNIADFQTVPDLRVQDWLV
jgi:tRNA(fMet)-specific endonuclease VapC